MATEKKWEKKDSIDDNEGEKDAKRQEYDDRKNRKKKNSMDDKKFEKDSKYKDNQKKEKQQADSEHLQEHDPKNDSNGGEKENDIVVNVEEIKDDGSSQQIIIKFHDDKDKLEEKKETAPVDPKQSHSKVPSVIFLNLKHNEETSKLDKLSHLLISEMLGNEIIKKTDLKKYNIHYDAKMNIYRAEQYHVTLFRLKNMDKYNDFNLVNFLDIHKKVTVGPYPISRIDLSTRFQSDADGFYKPLALINTSQIIQQVVDDSNSQK